MGEINPRLAKLDNDFLEKQIIIDRVFAVRGDHRVEVIVKRLPSGVFRAQARLKGFTRYSDSRYRPSDAFRKGSKQLKWMIDTANPAVMIQEAFK